MGLFEFMALPSTEIVLRQGYDQWYGKELKKARDRAERMAKSKGRRR